MCGYAALVVLVPRLRVRMDQAGDNSYYLGLLFTLSSMAFALYDFGVITRGTASIAGVQQIISNFGIALATTIAGIFLRVVLHQMRVDPADLEAMTRIELTEAAARLRTSLDTATIDLSRFHLELQQRSNDTTAELIGTVTEATKQLAEQTKDALIRIVNGTEKAHQAALTVTSGLTKNIGEAATETLKAVERLREVQPPPLLTSKRLERAAEALEQVALRSERTAEALDAVMEASNRGAVSIAGTAEKLAGLAVRVGDEHGLITERLHKALSALTESIDPLAARLGRLISDLTKTEEHSQRSVQESLRAQDAAVRVLTEMTSLAQKLTQLLKRS
jgi:hypothetical protein